MMPWLLFPLGVVPPPDPIGSGEYIGDIRPITFLGPISTGLTPVQPRSVRPLDPSHITPVEYGRLP
jgi:hypothetical protein